MSPLKGFPSTLLWQQTERAPSDQVFPLLIGLKIKEFEKLEKKLYEISDPVSEHYGEFLSIEKANELTKTDDHAVEKVFQWLNPSVQDATYHPSSNTITASIRVDQLEKLLNTQMHHFEKKKSVHPIKKQRLLRASSTIDIPDHLHQYISFLNVNSHPVHVKSLSSTNLVHHTPMVGHHHRRHLVQRKEVKSKSTLQIVRETYNIPSDLVVTMESNTQCTPAFYKEAWSQDDFETFYEKFLPGENVPTTIQRGNRVNNHSEPSGEASLDLQYLTSIARNATTYVWSVNGSNPFSDRDEPFLEFAQDIFEMENPPFVLSLSYSDDEAEIFRLSAEYARHFDILAMKLGLRGVSILFASGDDGVSGLHPEFANIPAERACEKSGPQWPSSSPYITSVGATMLKKQEAGYFDTKEEIVCSSEIGGGITTGGGFSNVYPMPNYQKKAVEAYLTNHPTRLPQSKGFYNRNGRAYPDIAALGSQFQVIVNQETRHVSGTSASTPVIAGMVTLWNDMRLKEGKPTLGFLNPLIYHIFEKDQNCFNDVVIGNIAAMKKPNRICPESFGASAGWDATTGVGTPNFPAFSEFIRQLGGPIRSRKEDDNTSKNQGTRSASFASSLSTDVRHIDTSNSTEFVTKTTSRTSDNFQFITGTQMEDSLWLNLVLMAVIVAFPLMLFIAWLVVRRVTRKKRNLATELVLKALQDRKDDLTRNIK